MGIGFASLFSGGFLWFQTKVAINNRIGGTFTFASSAGAQVFLVFASQIIEHNKIFIPYLILGSMILCIILMVGASLMGRNLKEIQNTKEEEELKDLSGNDKF